MQIPHVGEVVRNDLDWLVSGVMPIPFLEGQKCHVVLEGYEEDSNQEDFHTAIANALTATFDILREAEGSIFAYFKDVLRLVGDSEMPSIASPDEVWHHIKFGDSLNFL